MVYPECGEIVCRSAIGLEQTMEKVAESLESVAEVYINLNVGRLRHAFSYRVPATLAFIGPGWRVIVPFGSIQVEGFVWEVRALNAAGDADLKLIHDAPDEQAWFDADMLALARWISEYYVCAPGEALRLFIPGKSGIRSLRYYYAAPEAVSPLADPVYDFIRLKGPVSFSRLRDEFGAACRMDLQRLEKTGAIIATRRLKQRAVAKQQRILRLAVPCETAREAALAMRGRPAQQRLLQRLTEEESIPLQRLNGGTTWDSTAKALVRDGFAREEWLRVNQDSYRDMQGNCPPVTATSDQVNALAAILPVIANRQHQSFLLHGVTGSGKTEVYLQATAATLSAGRQVLVLIPEIAQTSQILMRFKARFGQRVAVVHSKLSLGERFAVWESFRSNETGVVIGTRSALFIPATDLGLIIVDEEHEFTYKQEEAPRYHVRDTAQQRASLAGASIIFGSATPSLESFLAAESGKHVLLELPRRVDGLSLPEVAVVDMREQLKLGRKMIVSAPLEELLRESLNKGEQAILLLNRRGYSTFVLCRECGYVMRCEHCNVPLVYHLQDGRLRCHYCDASHTTPTNCPSCHSRYIRYFGAGTQRLEEELAQLLPGVRLARMDQDTTGGKGSTDRILAEFRAGRHDILLGTQMVAKGHDIHNVTAVGILAADSTLNLPDFRAAEQTFALIMQAAGRAGRGALAGRVVVQTYHPLHYAVQAGSAQNYADFFASESAFRRDLFYPPFSRLLKLTVSGSAEARAMHRAEDVAGKLRFRLQPDSNKVEMIGPYVAPLSKIGDVYRVHILLQGIDLSRIKQTLAEDDIAGAGDITVDVDPLSMM